MSYPRASVDLSAYPDLVVVYLGYRAKTVRGLFNMMRIGVGLRKIMHNPPPGLLAHETCLFGWNHPGFRQYWTDFDSLAAFTRAPQHAAWWKGFPRDTRNGGIWHETYHMRGGMEAIYSDVPRMGFGRFAPPLDPVGSLASARQRVESSAPS